LKQSKISPRLKEFIRKWGKKITFGKNDAYQRHELLGGKINRLANLRHNSRTRNQARKLRDIIRMNPCRLLDDEVRLIRSLGIGMSRRIKEINVFNSGRVSVTWYARTKKQEDAINWALLALPAAGYKRKEVKRWLTLLVRQGKIKSESAS
jgi:hypothetical protein